MATSPHTIRFPDELWQRLSERAETEDRSVSYIAIRMIEVGLVETDDE
jgi:predicted transcriptional regulator